MFFLLSNRNMGYLESTLSIDLQLVKRFLLAYLKKFTLLYVKKDGFLIVHFLNQTVTTNKQIIKSKTVMLIVTHGKQGN